MSYKNELQNNNIDLQAILDSVNNLPEAGSGEGVKTCTVRILPHDGSMGIAGKGEWNGLIDYTKCENGVISSVFINGSNSMELVGAESGTEYDITLENVVCGSTLYIETYHALYIPDGDAAYGAKWDDVSGTHISAPTEPNVTLIIFIANEDVLG